MVGVTKFFRNVWVEMKRVTWPTGKELYGYTITVIITVIFLAVFFALVDLGISAIMKLIIK